MLFTSISALETAILQKCLAACELGENFVFQTMEDVLLQFYGEYDPVMYDRTYQLLTCCVRGGVKAIGDGFEAEVYFDSGLLNYLSGACPSGEQVLSAAKWGYHGAEGLAVANFSGTPIMQESMSRVSAQVFAIMKSAF